jgi:hypothetical protein
MGNAAIGKIPQSRGLLPVWLDFTVGKGKGQA